MLIVTLSSTLATWWVHASVVTEQTCQRNVYLPKTSKYKRIDSLNMNDNGIDEKPCGRYIGSREAWEVRLTPYDTVEDIQLSTLAFSNLH